MAKVGDALWLRYEKGKCSAQRIGSHSIAAPPSQIASFLKLPEPDKYTGHAFRRTAASALVEQGGDLLDLKQLGGWKSDSVAQGYVEDSAAGKRKRSEMLQGVEAAERGLAKDVKLQALAGAVHFSGAITPCGRQLLCPNTGNGLAKTE